MITKQQAINATYRQEFWHMSDTNADGTPMRCRVNGQCKTWKTRPNEFRLPVKHGFRDFSWIDQDNAHQWYDPREPGCPPGHPTNNEAT